MMPANRNKEAAMTPTKAPPASGCLFVLAAPSGGGKTSLVAALLEREPGIRLSVSFTTRAPRPGEIAGVHYHFVDEPRFLELKAAGEFLEHAFVHGHWYATSAVWLNEQIAHGNDVLLEIDWQGAAQVRRLDPGGCSRLHPAAITRVAEGAPRKARPGLARGHRTPARSRARRNAALFRVRLCYYESGLCTSRRRSVRDCARSPSDCAATSGAPRAAPASAARPMISTRIPWPASRSTTVSKKSPTASS